MDFEIAFMASFLLLIASIWIPYAIIFIGLLAFITITRNKYSASVTLLVAACFFVKINLNKAIEGDWIWYTQHYLYLREIDLYEYLGLELLGVMPKVTEPLYYIIAALSSKVSGGSIELISVLITLLIYIPAGMSINYMASADNTAVQKSLCTIATLFLGITFTITLQLVRQEIAVSFLALAVAGIYAGRFKLAAILMVLAALTHNSSVILSILIILGYYLAGSSKKIPLFLGSLFAVFVVGWLFATYGIGEADQYDGEVNFGTYVYDACLFSSFLLLRFLLGINDKKIDFLLISVILYLSFISGVSKDVLLALRFYLYADTFRLALIGWVLLNSSKIMEIKWILPVATIGGFVYLFLRMKVSPFYFNGDLIFHLFS